MTSSILVVNEVVYYRGYMVRYNKCGRKKGHNVNLISAQWFNTWRLYTEFEVHTEC